MTDSIKINCYQCGKGISLPEDDATCISFIVVETKCFRMFEKPTDYRYESFNIPDKIERFFCNKQCSVTKLKASLELFLAEISPIRPKGRVGSTLSSFGEANL